MKKKKKKKKKNEELRELDTWIAEHVMGFTLSSGHPPHWYSSDSDRVYFVRLPEDDDSAIYWQPATDPAAAMEVLKKIIEKDGSAVIYAEPDGGYIMCSDDIEDTKAETLELAICLFAKKFFTK